MKYNNTKIVNAFAGPGAGKTTACLEIVSQLKMRGKSAEYVPEYAKELVWDERTQLLDGSLMNQLTILCEQYKRIKRLFHKVDYIVTDSPLWLNLLYYRYSSYKQRNVYMDLLQDIEILKNQYNWNFFIKRDLSSFEKNGRVQNLNESIKIDKEIYQFLVSNNIPFTEYTHSNIQTAVEDILRIK